MTLSTRCKICGETAVETFRIPSSKLTGQPIPEMPDDCAYYECTRCRFCFTDILDTADHAGVYDESYWNNQDPDWHGRVTETLRLVLLANTLLVRDPAKIEILDFGCGMGTFIQTAREKLGMQVWGHDIIEPKFGKEFFLKELPERKFDIIVSCEVLEHLPFPYEILKGALRSLKSGGVLAFQTAYYDPEVCKRDWWYIGPANGHVSLYSVGSLEMLFQKLGGVKRMLWNDYPGIQAWQISNTGDLQSTPLKDMKTQKGASSMQESICGTHPETTKQGSSIRLMIKTIAPEWVKRIYRRARCLLAS